MAKHGTLSRYTNGKCRCSACKAAGTKYRRDRNLEMQRLAKVGRVIERLAHGKATTDEVNALAPFIKHLARVIAAETNEPPRD